MRMFYSNDTLAQNAIDISAGSGEIVHVQCPSRDSAVFYVQELKHRLEDEEEFGSLKQEIEIVGKSEGKQVHVHVSIQ